MSVSNYLNKRFHLMGRDTRERIEVAIRELNYRPRSQAKGFRMGRDFSVGMIVVDPSPNYLTEPFIAHVVSGLSGELARNKHACLLQSVPDCHADENLIENFARADALCVFASGDDKDRDVFFRTIAELGKPIVAIEEERDLSELGIVNVRQDDAGGARKLVQHLWERGARDLLYVTPTPTWPANAARERAAGEEVARLGGRLRRLTCGFGNFDDVQDAIGEWHDRGGRCDAIMANNDHIGIAVIATLRERGLEVPDDVLVTGFNGFEFWNYSSPRLTTVVSATEGLGRLAAQVLLRRIAGNATTRSEHILPVRFRPDRSTMRADRPSTAPPGSPAEAADPILR